MMKLRRMGLPRHVARLAEGIYAHTILLRELLGKRQFGTSERKWEDKNKKKKANSMV
jgi:hypothetical protein